MPQVSIIIPTHDRAALLGETIESALKAGSDVEVIVVDDASTDDTAEICEKIPNIRYLRLACNSGVAVARNTAVLASSAEFIAFLDDDDLRLPNTIDAQIQILKAEPDVALVYGRVLMGDSRRVPTGQVLPPSCPQGDVFYELLTSNFILTNSVVARRQSLITAGLFRAKYSPAEDWDLWLRMGEHAPFRGVEEAVAIYRSANPASGQATSDHVRMFREILNVQATAMLSARARGASVAKRRQIRRRLREMIYKVLVYQAGCALAEGNKVLARHKLLFAWRVCPFSMTAFWWLLRSVVSRQRSATWKSEPPQRVYGD
jgi:glycosyltransferase involved in cell wall biosynthesis